jgi:hypothetical protein
MPLVVIKSEMPSYMKSVMHYPCEYKAIKNAWVTAKLFRVVALFGDILLLLD